MGLSLAFLDAGLRVGRPYECLDGRAYLPWNDVLNPVVLEGLERDILSGYVWYLALGTPCKSFGPAV